MKEPGFSFTRIKDLTDDQQAVVTAPIRGSILLTGEAGSGKTTAGVQRMRYLVEQGIAGDSILVLVPQRSLAETYFSQLHASDFPPGSQPTILTFNGVAQHMISLFWPLVAANAGFHSPTRPVRYLTIETAQYYLATLVEPLLQQGYFESLTIDPNRLYSQILDNLNKSAVVGFPPSEIAARLTQAWAGKTSQVNIFQQAQECALKFRDFCLFHNFLDFSLQLTVFSQYLWPSLFCKEYIKKSYRHLIYDNMEEDFPVAHDFVADLLPDLESALLILDSGGGFRSFLGADPVSAARLGNRCKGKMQLSSSHVKSYSIDRLERALPESILTHRLTDTSISGLDDCYTLHPFRFYPEVMDWVISEIQELLQQRAVSPGEVAILTPFLSDALRFSFASRLESAGIPFTTYRPSRSLRDEPAVKTILTLVKIAHPSWSIQPTTQETRAAISQAITDCDFARADLISRTLYRLVNQEWSLNSFDTLRSEMQERITFQVGEHFEVLRNWLFDNKEGEKYELDHWISRLYGECLSQPGFGFHEDYDAAAAASHLIDSCRKFRNIYDPVTGTSTIDSGKEYIRVLEQGILAAQSITSLSQQRTADAVFLSPAFSFLMRNKPVSYQFWLDIGSQGWWSRLDQPLTQPYVLSRNWEQGKQWTDIEEYETNQKTLARLTTGLLRRCSQHVYMCSVAYNERGMEERGQLMLAMQTIQRQRSKCSGAAHV